MIKEIGYIPNINLFDNYKINKNSKDIVNMPYSLQKTTPVANYSVKNIQAYYITFTGTNTDTAKKITEIQDGGILPVYRKNFSSIAFENVTMIPQKELVEGKYYDKTANNIASALGPSKNIMVIQQDEVMPELVVHNFAKNLKEGKYNKTGLINYNTEVFFFNPEHMDFNSEEENYFNVVIENLASLSKKNPNKEKVVFMKDFEDFLSACSKAKGIENLFDRDSFEYAAPNIHLVGLIPQSELKPKTSEDILNGDKPKFDPKKFKYVRKVELDGLGANKTKEFLKNDISYMNDVLKRYDKVWFDVKPGAIDAIVDGSAYKYGGTFPKKGLNILDLIAASMANQVSSDAMDRIKIEITDTAVKDFFRNHSDLIKYLKFDDSVFSFSENVTTRLDDVGGASEAKEEIKKIIEFAKDPEKFIADSNLRTIPKGIIMAGPTGTGKTLLARAVAGEAGVPFSTIAASELIKKYVGEGEEAVREWFGKLRQAALDSEKNVAIGFIDEIDAIGRIRSAEGDGGSEAKASILNQLLIEMDGFNNKESDVHLIILSATNREDILDPALKRPGRFDAVVNVLAPENFEERLDVLEKHVKNLPFKNKAEKARILNEISMLTETKSGADIAKMVDITKEVVANRPKNRIITYDDMFEGFLQTLMGKKHYTKRPLEERRRTVIHEAGHAALIDSLDATKLSLISNESRGHALGVTIFQPLQGNPHFKNIIKDMAASYAGGDAELLIDLMGHDAGVSGDYTHLTDIAEKAIKKWGLGIHTPLVSFLKEDGSPNKYLEELYREEIKKDIEIYTQLAKKISEMGINFQKDFLTGVYLKKFDEEIAAGKGGNVLSGDEFRAMKQNWLESTGKVKEYKKLQLRIDAMIEHVQKSAKNVLKKNQKHLLHLHI